MHPLVSWVEQREAIRKRKEAGEPAPWTDDPILAKYRFCNVRRKDDRVSRWLKENVLKTGPLRPQDDDLAPYLMTTALCRWLNWPPTILELQPLLLPPLDWPKIGAAVDARAARGEKTWTGAFMVRAERTPKFGKGKFIAERVIGREMEAHMTRIKAALASQGRQQVHAVLCDLYTWGSFMAGQVVDDWSWTTVLGGAADNYTLAPIGPGSRRGFNRLMRRPLNGPVAEEEFCTKLQEWRGSIISELGAEFQDLTLMDVQNCCCEYDKYTRARLGEGRPRSMYKPERAF